MTSKLYLRLIKDQMVTVYDLRFIRLCIHLSRILYKHESIKLKVHENVEKLPSHYYQNTSLLYNPAEPMV